MQLVFLERSLKVLEDQMSITFSLVITFKLTHTLHVISSLTSFFNEASFMYISYQEMVCCSLLKKMLLMVTRVSNSNNYRKESHTPSDMQLAKANLRWITCY